MSRRFPPVRERIGSNKGICQRQHRAVDQCREGKKCHNGQAKCGPDRVASGEFQAAKYGPKDKDRTEQQSHIRQTGDQQTERACDTASIE